MTLGFSRFSHSRPANLLQLAFFSESSETLVKYFKSYEVTRRWEPKAYYLIFQEEQLVFKRDPKGRTPSERKWVHVTPSMVEKKFFFIDRDQFYDQTSLTTTNYHQIYVTSEQKSDQNVRRLLELVAQRAKTQTSIDELIEEKNQTEVEINKLCRKIGVDSEPEE